ncbi:hypothetical protein ACFTWH_27185 [Streptomyces sp. NPDC057011]|uniref:hypothetical protein n=1 Tax=unclassified Streptomyces TaxID=2593676 RepID=UPI0036331BCA
MKVWQLYSACRDNLEAIELAAPDVEWRVEYELLRGAPEWLRRGEEQKLDYELPAAFCRKVLGGVSDRYHESDGYIRVARIDPAAGELSAVDVFDRYGGVFLEDVNEAGLAEIPQA